MVGISEFMYRLTEGGGGSPYFLYTHTKKGRGPNRNKTEGQTLHAKEVCCIVSKRASRSSHHKKQKQKQKMML
ncbi:hypothetical protein [Candidatus Cardinium hertigii]|uniref:hypothetical protein n=1 Tax=Candidatus Cardinium hertigii TaxID=247481 RepID=UPI0013A54990|nr:hypothetical protein [Candidatus Cardinium hertigii]